MSKEVQMTFRVESELRASFSEATALAHRSAAQVLREFMLAYVNASSCRDVNQPVSAAARYQREEAVNFARASVALEGFTQHKDDEELIRRYIAGEITVADAIKSINGSIHER